MKEDNTKPVNATHLHIVRQTVVFLILKIIFIWFITNSFFLLSRVFYNYFAGYINLTDNLFTFYTFLFVILSFLNVISTIVVVFDWSNQHYEIRPGEIVLKKGLFTLKESSFSLSDMQLTLTTQGIFGKIFNYGDIKIHNPIIRQNFVLKSIPNPRRYLQVLKEAALSKNKTKVIPILT